MNPILRTRKAMMVMSILLMSAGWAQAAPQKSSQAEKSPSISIELSGKGNSFFPEGEMIVYKKILEAYQTNDLVQLYKERDLLLKYYPESIHADNALYLAGLLDLQKGRMAEALKNFNRILNQYPLGNKAASALFAKGMTYKKLNVNKTAKDVLVKLIKQFPRSPERRRAEMELEILKRKG